MEFSSFATFPDERSTAFCQTRIRFVLSYSDLTPWVIGNDPALLCSRTRSGFHSSEGSSSQESCNRFGTRSTLIFEPCSRSCRSWQQCNHNVISCWLAKQIKVLLKCLLLAAPAKNGSKDKGAPA